MDFSLILVAIAIAETLIVLVLAVYTLTLMIISIYLYIRYRKISTPTHSSRWNTLRECPWKYGKQSNKSTKITSQRMLKRENYRTL